MANTQLNCANTRNDDNTVWLKKELTFALMFKAQGYKQPADTLTERQ